MALPAQNPNDAVHAQDSRVRRAVAVIFVKLVDDEVRKVYCCCFGTPSWHRERVFSSSFRPHERQQHHQGTPMVVIKTPACELLA